MALVAVTSTSAYQILRNIPILLFLTTTLVVVDETSQALETLTITAALSQPTHSLHLDVSGQEPDEIGSSIVSDIYGPGAWAGIRSAMLIEQFSSVDAT
jgi:hypothetical protein